jgi:hypothetical protein
MSFPESFHISDLLRDAETVTDGATWTDDPIVAAIRTRIRAIIESRYGLATVPHGFVASIGLEELRKDLRYATSALSVWSDDLLANSLRGFVRGILAEKYGVILTGPSAPSTPSGSQTEPQQTSSPSLSSPDSTSVAATSASPAGSRSPRSSNTSKRGVTRRATSLSRGRG